ncbi:MAG: hypothetical protein J5496_09345 [Lachnospiraceae bacterium]|nr:hypothetical protein [Lachnospiraceae bacterium]
MKTRILLLFGILLLLGLCACGSFSASEKPVSGKYYLTLLPDKKGKNTVENVQDVTLRLKVGGGLVKTVRGDEKEGSWKSDGKTVTFRFRGEVQEGKVKEDRIEIGDAVYIRGLKEARDLWQADADAYVADPLAEYEGKYYVAGLLEDGQNRVQAVDDDTVWLMPENEALQFHKGSLTLLSWDADRNRIVLKSSGSEQSYLYQNGQLSGRRDELEICLFRDRDEAEAFLKEHPYVPKPHIPVRSGLEGEYFLAYATAFGKPVDIGRAGAVRISLMPDWVMHYEGDLYSEEGSYSFSPDGSFELTSASGSFAGTAENGCLDLRDAGGDRYLFFNSLDRAKAYYDAYQKPSVPDEPRPTEPVTESERETEPAVSDPASEEAGFWQGTWYGLVRLNNDCSGLYFLMRGKCYTVYVTLSMRSDGTGTLVAYDPAQTFAERLLSGSVRCGENKSLILTEGLIEPFSAVIGGYRAAWDESRQLVSLRLTQALSGGSIGGELLLRPWGEGWEDQPELMKLLPDYEAYLEEIQTGTPRYRAE